MAERRIRRILVATDGTSSARDAVEIGVELAEVGDAELTFLHAVPREVSLETLNEWIKPAPESLPDHGDDALDEAAVVASSRGVPFERELVLGDPRDVILARAEALDADLIVLGERPRRLRVGPSVSRWVARHTRRAVLVARPPAARRPAA
jgi:nucleotide-binding universal stress UspA family protein